MKAFIFILLSIFIFKANAFENKTIGEFCEQRIKNPQLIEIAKFAEYFENKNSSDELKTEYEKIPLGQLFIANEAEKETNKPKNRYEKYPAYDHSRVKLTEIGDASLGDYINANYIPGVNLTQRYIATQGPVKASANDFWRAVWENDVKNIVMLTRLYDHGKEKCYKYWPEDTARYGPITVTLEKSDHLSDYIVRTFLVGYNGEVRRVFHAHYIIWPDEGVPENVETILNFLNLVRNSKYYKPHRPLLVHCSGGMGRTGTFILLDSLIQAAKMYKNVDPAYQLCKMREKRINLVETYPQYRLVHEALIKATAEKEEAS